MSQKDTKAGVAQIMQAIEQQQKLVAGENTRLQQIQAIQGKLIEKQRTLLVDVSNTNKELLEVEKKRAELKEKLASQKTQLLVASSEAQEISQLVNEVLQQAPESPDISATQSGNFAAKVVDTVAAQITEITDKCLKSETLSVSGDELQNTIIVLNQLLQKVIDAGIATEQTEDTIRRQSYTISALVQGPEE